MDAITTRILHKRDQILFFHLCWSLERKDWWMYVYLRQVLRFTALKPFQELKCLNTYYNKSLLTLRKCKMMVLAPLQNFW